MDVDGCPGVTLSRQGKKRTQTLDWRLLGHVKRMRLPNGRIQGVMVGKISGIGKLH